MLKFDDLKMNNPAIQNDFSYYRRTLSKMKMNNAVRKRTARGGLSRVVRIRHRDTQGYNDRGKANEIGPCCKQEGEKTGT